MGLISKFGLLSVWCLILTLQSAIIFDDDFNKPQHSVNNWTFISENDSGMQFSRNALNITNKSDVYSALAFHKLSSSPASITVSADIVSEYPGSGIYICLNESADSYNGYAVLLADNGIYVYKFYPESLSVISDKVCPFVKLGENRLTVSRWDNLISIFCNGFFICSVYDDEFDSGDVALIVPPLSEASFDNFIVSDTPVDTFRFTPFIDEFDTKSTFGWSKYGDAVCGWRNGQFQIKTGKNQLYHTGLEMPLNSFSMKTVVQFNSGDSGSFYGFFMRTAADTGDSVEFHYFGISGDREIAVYPGSGKDAGIIIVDDRKNIPTNMFDTLELLSSNNIFTLLVNGSVLYKSSDILKTVTGAGIYVSNSLDISFERFELIDLEKNTLSMSFKRAGTKRKIENQTLKYVDLLGRDMLKNSFNLPMLTLRKDNNENWIKCLKMRKGNRLR